MLRDDRSNRPVLDLPLTPLQVSLEILSAIGLLSLVLVVALAVPGLPERVPTHFGASGVADGWGPKSTVWILPAVGTFLYVMLTVFLRYPQIYNYPVPITPENAERQYQAARTLLSATKAEILGLFVYLGWGTVAVASGRAQGLGLYPMAMLPVLLVSVIVYTIQARRAR